MPHRASQILDAGRWIKWESNENLLIPLLASNVHLIPLLASYLPFRDAFTSPDSPRSITWCPIWCFTRHQIRHQSNLVSNLMPWKASKSKFDAMESIIWCHGKHQKAWSDAHGASNMHQWCQQWNQNMSFDLPTGIQNLWCPMGHQVIQHFLSVICSIIM